MNSKMNLFTLSIILMLLTQFLNAQDCRLYFPDKKGAIREMKSYDQKNKLTSVAKQEILDKKVSGNDVSITVRSTNFSADDKEVYTADLELVCENGVFKFDMKNFLDPNTMSAYKDMGLEITGDNLLYPSGFKVGDALPDGTITMKVKSNEMTVMNITLTISNRKVEGNETINTEAGTFPCYKITYDTTSKVGFISVNTSVAEWIAESVGVVRTESYNRKGRLIGYSVLTKYSN